MADYAALERTLSDTLQLTRRPVAITFGDAPPDGVRRLGGSHPSGCTFWSLAAAGEVFYTAPEDHYNCPIGSYTHHIALPADRERELPDTLSLMSDLGYVRMEEVPAIPRLPQTPVATVYAPLAAAPVDPDVVLIAGSPGSLMLLHEAATRTGVPVASLLGRPTCMAIPAALSTGMASSLGCVGNRIYTGLKDEEFYSVVRMDTLQAIARELATIVAANVVLTQYHHERRAAIGA